MKRTTEAMSRKGLVFAFLIVGLLTALIVLPFQFRSQAGGKGIERTTSHEPGIDDFDISDNANKEQSQALAEIRAKVGKDASFVADLRDGFARGEEAFKQRHRGAKVEYNTNLRSPSVLTPDVWKDNIEWLTPPSSGSRVDTLRNFLKQNNELLGMSDAQIDALKTDADYTNPDGNLSYTRFVQQANGIPVFRGEIQAGFRKNGQMIRAVNALAPGLDYDSLSTDFASPVDAVRAAAGKVNYTLKAGDDTPNQAASDDLKIRFGNGGDWDITAEKMYFPTEPGVAVPAWRVLIWKPVQAYYVIVEAGTGKMLFRQNLAADQTQSATYNVWTNSSAYVNVADNPNPLTPGPIDPTLGTQGARIARNTVSVIGNEGTNSFNNLGWITDGGNTTDGNNNEAGMDRDTTNGVDAASIPVGSPNRTFNFPINPGNPVDNTGDSPLPVGATPTPCQAAPPATIDFQRAAAVQMFYTMNVYHDELYKRGFTEPARNYQNDNFGRGGAAADRISSEGQDCSGTNNANFASGADGVRGRMQMFLWTGPTPDFDGTIDNEVIIHEVSHGTSNRLHNGLGNQGGMMGEGWSDWYGHTMLSQASDPINGIYTTGGYATHLVVAGFTANYYYGIRRFPKAVIAFTGGPNRPACNNGPCPHNPLTFRHINAGCDTEIGTTTSAVISAFPRGPIGLTGSCSQVHNAGEVWSSALWEVRSLMVTRLGHSAGTTRALQVVTDGMKLAPPNPMMLQERDAIIAAAAALPAAPEASADVADVREGFRRRGMGFLAQTISASQVVEDFSSPNAVHVNPFSVSDSPGDNDGFPEPSEPVLLSVPVNNSTGATVNAVQVNVNGGPNVSYGNINDGQTVTMNIPFTIPSGAACGSELTVMINVSSAIGTQPAVNRTFRLGAPAGGAPQTFSNTTAINLPDSGPSAPYGNSVAVSGLTFTNAKMSLKLNGYTHTFPADNDFLLTGPGGTVTKFVPMSDQGGGGDIVNANIELRDDAATAIPATIPAAGGIFRPTADATADTFPAPAPAAPYTLPAPGGAGTFASTFGTASSGLNGTWNLYIIDDAGIDTGTIAGGWSLTFESNDFTCNFTAVNKTRADFDGDGRTDLSVFRPSDTVWYLQQSTAGFSAVAFGAATDQLVPGDYDGDGKADRAVFRPSMPGMADFQYLRSTNNTVAQLEWGTLGDIPVVGDYDGDAKTDLAIFRPSEANWYILRSSNGANQITPFGLGSDIPVSGDFDGDGRTDLTVYRSGVWFIWQSTTNTQVALAWGSAGDILAHADYDGDSKEDIGVFRPSTGQWIYRRSLDNTAVFVNFGASGDVPVPGDYDGDGKEDQAIYRNGTWWLNRSTAGVATQGFGLATDTAVPRRYLP